MIKRVIALGFFDGVHIGHQAILKQTAELARARGMESAAITFENHPRSFVRGVSPEMITSLSERCEWLKRYGAQQVFALSFDRQTADTSPRDFAQKLVHDFGAAVVVCGQSFRFGRDAEGTPELFESLGIEVAVCERVTDENGRTISSTAIRQLVRDGEMEMAARYLGRPFSITGEVVRGFRIGHHLGFPTMNLRAGEGMLMPRRGVYASRVAVDGYEYGALTNVGSRPTFSSADIVSIESHILSFEGELYGKTASVRLLHFLRPETAFNSADELKAQIARDLEQAEAPQY